MLNLAPLIESRDLPPSPLWGGIEGGGSELTVRLNNQYHIN